MRAIMCVGGSGFRANAGDICLLGIGLFIMLTWSARAVPPEIVEGSTTNVVMAEDGSPTAFGLQLNAVDSDADALSWAVGTPATNGTPGVSPATGTVVDISYDPDPNYHGTDQFTIRVADTHAETDEITVNVTILPQNDAPHLTANGTLQVRQTQILPITPDLLSAADVDTHDTTQLIYTIDPDSFGGVVQVGTLTLDGGAVTSGTQFTQADIEAEALVYAVPITDEGQDSFTFNVQDSEGALASDSEFTTFTFRIQILFTNVPPVAINGAGENAIGASSEHTFHASDSNLPPQTLTFRIVQDGLFGHGELLDPTNGTFRYTHTGTVDGVDTLLFQVNDGGADAAQPGEFEITVRNTPPTSSPLSVVSIDGRPVRGQIVASDPDRPEQTLTFVPLTNGTIGTAVIDSATGSFTYTPHEGRFGDDRFWFAVDDGVTSSVPIDVMVHTTHVPVEGDMILARKHRTPENVRYGSLVVIDSITGDAVELTTGGFLVEPNGVAFDPIRRVIYSTDAAMENPVPPRVIETDPRDGSQRIVSDGGMLLFPLGIGVEKDGNIVVNDLAGRKVLRIDPESGTQTVVTADGHLAAPSGLDVQPDGRILVLDAQTVGSPDGLLVEVNPTNGTQTVLSSNQNFVIPIDLCVTASGTVYVTDLAGLLIEIDPTSGTQTVISAGLDTPIGLATPDGRHVFHTSSGGGSGGSTDGTLYRVDSDAGSSSVFLEEGLVDAGLWGLSAVPPMGWIRDVRFATNGAEIAWHTITGQVYRLESKNNLTDDEWTLEDHIMGTGGWMRWQAPTSEALHGFYRCVPEP
jgi:sugar lactone lactonase YvrE